MLKRVFGILMTGALVLGLIPASVLATPTQKVTKEQVQQFEQLGFSDDEIANLSDEEINRLSDKHGKLVSKVTKYYRVTNEEENMKEITKEEALKEVQDYKDKKAKKVSGFSIMSSGSDTEPTGSWLTMTTSVSDLGNKDFYFKNSFTWLTDPWFHFSDVIGMSHNSSISVISGSDYLKVIYTKYNVTTRVADQVDYYYTATSKNSFGYAYKFPLRGTSDPYSYKYPHGYLIYEGLAAPSNFVGPSNVYGHYDHQQAAASLGINLSTGALSVSPSYAIDKAVDTDVSFYIS